MAEPIEIEDFFAPEDAKFLEDQIAKVEEENSLLKRAQDKCTRELLECTMSWVSEKAYIARAQKKLSEFGVVLR